MPKTRVWNKVVDLRSVCVRREKTKVSEVGLVGHPGCYGNASQGEHLLKKTQ